MLIKYLEIKDEFNLMNVYLQDELKCNNYESDENIEHLIEYLEHLNDRYLRGECAHRPDWVTKYINNMR